MLSTLSSTFSSPQSKTLAEEHQKEKKNIDEIYDFAIKPTEKERQGKKGKEKPAK